MTGNSMTRLAPQTLFQFGISALLALASCCDGLAQTYAPAVNYGVPPSPEGIVAADFNNDGKMDLAVTNNSGAITAPGSVSILLGRGDGTFDAPISVQVGDNPLSVTAADFNGDGNVDLAITLGSSNPATQVQMLLGNGNGTFQSPINLAVPSNGFTQIVSADWNSDGHPDLAVASSTGILILLNDGAGHFALISTVAPGAIIPLLTVADFNGDGIPDIAYISETPSFGCGVAGLVTIVFGAGNGTFPTGTDPSDSLATATSGGIAAADLNHDGRMDLIVTDAGAGIPCPSNGSVQIALQNADGSFAPATRMTNTLNPGYVIVGDFNGDGNSDVATLQTSPNIFLPNPDLIMIYPGVGNGSFLAPRQFSLPTGAGAVVLTAGTFTNVGALDLAVTDFSVNAVSVLLNMGASTLSLASSLNPVGPNQTVTLTATVHPLFGGLPTPTGSVIFADGGVTLGAAPLNSLGSGSLNVSFSTVGSHNLLAVFGGDINFVGGSSNTLAEAVDRAPTATALDSNNNPSGFGATVTLTATITGPSGSPSGFVTFLDGGISIGTGPLNSSGVATLTTSTLTVGPHSITASYGGDASHSSSLSSALIQTVAKAGLTIAMASSENPSIYGDTVTFTFTFAGVAGTTPTGTAVITKGGTTLATVTLDAAGKTTFTTSSLKAGTHSITVVYNGDANYF